MNSYKMNKWLLVIRKNTRDYKPYILQLSIENVKERE